MFIFSKIICSSFSFRRKYMFYYFVCILCVICRIWWAVHNFSVSVSAVLYFLPLLCLLMLNAEVRTSASATSFILLNVTHHSINKHILYNSIANAFYGVRTKCERVCACAFFCELLKRMIWMFESYVFYITLLNCFFFPSSIRLTLLLMDVCVGGYICNRISQVMKLEDLTRFILFQNFCLNT